MYNANKYVSNLQFFIIIIDVFINIQLFSILAERHVEQSQRDDRVQRDDYGHRRVDVEHDDYKRRTAGGQ